MLKKPGSSNPVQKGGRKTESRQHGAPWPPWGEEGDVRMLRGLGSQRRSPVSKMYVLLLSSMWILYYLVSSNVEVNQDISDHDFNEKQHSDYYSNCVCGRCRRKKKKSCWLAVHWSELQTSLKLEENEINWQEDIRGKSLMESIGRDQGRWAGATPKKGAALDEDSRPEGEQGWQR